MYLLNLDHHLHQVQFLKNVEKWFSLMVHKLTIESCNIFKTFSTFLFLLIFSATLGRPKPNNIKNWLVCTMYMVPSYWYFSILEQFQSCSGQLKLGHKETSTMNESPVSLFGKALDFCSLRNSWFESQQVHFVFLPFFQIFLPSARTSPWFKSSGWKNCYFVTFVD